MNTAIIIERLQNIMEYDDHISSISHLLLKECVALLKEDLEAVNPSSLIGMDVSIDVSTGDDDSCNRVFATVYDYVEGQPITLLCNDVTANFVTTSSAEEVLIEHAQLHGLTK